MVSRCAGVLFAVLALSSAWAQNNVPVPKSCTPQVNEKLGNLLSSGEKQSVDNVMVCGITLSLRVPRAEDRMAAIKYRHCA